METKTKEIDGNSYELSQLTAFRALRLFTRIGAVAGPAMGQLGSLMVGGDVDVAKAGDFVAALFEKLDEKELEHFVREMLLGGGLKRDNVPMEKVFDTEMAGKALTVFKLLLFGFEVNYGDFFAAAQSWVKPRAAVVANSSKE